MIDEKKLIEELRMEYECADDLSDFTCGVKRGLSEALTIVKYQQKVGEWIPVEERLPEEAGVYRVTCLYADKVYRVKDDLFYSDRNWGYDNPNLNRKVIAWKPLERPYEVKENE